MYLNMFDLRSFRMYMQKYKLQDLMDFKCSLYYV